MRNIAAIVCLSALLGPLAAQADSMRTAMLDAFALHCFSPHLTAAGAAAAIAPTGARFDFYDLAPFSAPASSPASTPITKGTDRRCEVSFDGDYGARAAEVAQATLAAEGITTETAMPDTHTPLPGTTLLGARELNPGRAAVVHTGTRPGPNGPETFLSVERLTPEASREVLP